MREDVYWYTVVALDILHIPLALVFRVFGKLWMPDQVHNIMMAGILALQVICLGCPLNVLTCWLRKKKTLSIITGGR